MGHGVDELAVRGDPPWTQAGRAIGQGQTQGRVGSAPNVDEGFQSAVDAAHIPGRGDRPGHGQLAQRRRQSGLGATSQSLDVVPGLRIDRVGRRQGGIDRASLHPEVLHGLEHVLGDVDDGEGLASRLQSLEYRGGRDGDGSEKQSHHQEGDRLQTHAEG